MREGSTAFGIAAAVLIADIATKSVIVQQIPERTVHKLTPWFNLGHWLNTGAAFSFLAQAGGWQCGFFTVLGIVASVVLSWLIARSRSSRPERIGYAAILGGALGNVVDRAFRGAVVDWLDFHVGRWHWPAFNLADVGITLGVVALLLSAKWRTAAVARASDHGQ